MTISLALQATYTAIELALAQENSIIASISIDKLRASADLIPSIDALLKNNHKKLSDLSCIIVNQGPGPFTTLRVAITTANGIAFATKIPLIGIDGMQTLCAAPSPSPIIIGLLNAFNHDLYFGIKQGTSFESGYAKAEELLPRFAQETEESSIEFRGNGAQMYQDLIKQLFGDRAVIATQEFAHLSSVVDAGHEQWQKQVNVSMQLQPLYLKQAMV